MSASCIIALAYAAVLSTPAEAKSSDRYQLALLGETPSMSPIKFLKTIDWRLRKLAQLRWRQNTSSDANSRALHFRNTSFYARPVKILGVTLSIKCADIQDGRPMDAHCPGVHYIVKHVAMRILFLTLGSLAAAMGTCELASAKKFQERRSTVLRQIPLSRRNTVMRGFDLLRSRNRVFEIVDYGGGGGGGRGGGRVSGSGSYPGGYHTGTSMQLFDVKDSGRKEELLRHPDVTD
ncbi:hypothetical protein BOX15_Mlig003489g2 [Macrostomum lignano]|uniref:Uncharacterized protein n=2 Tax=Macrostomum lignano TaxID=282301 RepID=A0A267GLG5_9PLAT|nr:hypothetical protein BOX15_Mlig003489g2 [Macrostomum lignano]